MAENNIKCFQITLNSYLLQKLNVSLTHVLLDMRCP